MSKDKVKKPISGAKCGGIALSTGIIFNRRVGSALHYSVAVRTPDGGMSTTTKIIKTDKRPTNIINKMFAGLNFAYKMAVDEHLKENGGRFNGEIDVENEGTSDKLFAGVFGTLFALAAYVFLPLLILLPFNLLNNSVMGILESISIPVALVFTAFFIFILGNKKLQPAKYHGAEHMAIKCLDAGVPLTIENVRKQRRTDVRCGTSFIMLLLLIITAISVLAFTLVFPDIGNYFLRSLIRIIIIPISFIITFMIYYISLRSKKSIAKAFIHTLCAPGLFLQNLFVTKNPDIEHIEVAITGLKLLLSIKDPARTANNNEPWLSWAIEMQAIAQIGLTYTKDVFDMERYARMREIAAEIMAAKSGLDTAVVQNLFCNEVGYQTPKLDTRAAIFKGGKILLVKERERWAMPGGWVDVLETVGVNSIKEVKEETGFDARPLRLIALLDKKRQNNPSLPYGAITAFVLCELISESGFIKNNETTDAAWFSLSDLPELATEKNSAEQIEMCFRANDDANWVVLFD